MVPSAIAYSSEVRVPLRDGSRPPGFALQLQLRLLEACDPLCGIHQAALLIPSGAVGCGEVVLNSVQHILDVLNEMFVFSRLLFLDGWSCQKIIKSGTPLADNYHACREFAPTPLLLMYEVRLSELLSLACWDVLKLHLTAFSNYC